MKLMILVLICFLQKLVVVSPDRRHRLRFSFSLYRDYSNKYRKSHHKQNPEVVNMTAEKGADVMFNCLVSDLKDKTVSWLKRSDGHLALLTVGTHTYIGDGRFSLKHIYPNNWRLSIRSIKPFDAGTYECQVSSHPPTKFIVYLHVYAPLVEIVDEKHKQIQEKYFQLGSMIQLKCLVKDLPSRDTYITWNHWETNLNQDVMRGGISVKTDLQVSPPWSKLSIAQATPQDSGNYTCSLGKNAHSTIVVHVLDGDHQAAMQLGSGCTERSNRIMIICCMVTLLFMPRR